jgi:hypothetical protein
VFFLRLILAEEAHLITQLGEPYQEYLRAVPRLLPKLRTSLPPLQTKPHWLPAILTEINPIGIFISIAFLSWTYNNDLMVKAVVVILLISLMQRALMLAPIATCVFLLIAGIAWRPFHMRPLKAAIISLGVALIVHAVLPRKKAA